MSAAMLKNTTTISRVLVQKHSIKINHFIGPIKVETFCNQTPSRPYFRLPYFLRKTKEYEISPSLFCSSSSSASSTSSSLSKVGLVAWYLGMVKSRPILTKSITCSLIYTAADLSSQILAKPSSEPYNVVRTLRMAGYGMLILGPSLHYWFTFVSKVLPKRDLSSTLKKIFMAQAFYGPCMTVVFFSLNACLQGETSTEIVARLKRDLVPTMLNGVLYWPACDFITYRFIPVHLQPLVSNSFSYLWTIYMTYMASRERAAVAS